MAELADAPDLRSGGRDTVWVRPPLPLPYILLERGSKVDPLNEHPLQGNPHWVFNQPTISLQQVYKVRLLEGAKANTIERAEENAFSLLTYSHCREGLIINVRQGLHGRLTTKQKSGDKSWECKTSPSHEVVFEDEVCAKSKVPPFGDNVIHITHTNMVKAGVSKAEFLQVVNCVLGIPWRLLNPHWHPPTTALQEAKIANGAEAWGWDGIGNFSLRHPALLAISTGLYRQAALLCAAGQAKEVLATVSADEVEAALQDKDWRPAFGLAERLRPWISVPVPPGASIGNFPFPWGPRKAKQVSYWQRFIRLQRGARRHGYDAVLGRSLHESWALAGLNTEVPTGVVAFWGAEKALTPAHKKVMELGKPLKRKTGAEEGEI